MKRQSVIALIVQSLLFLTLPLSIAAQQESINYDDVALLRWYPAN
jgi:YVTN family beta-propeller protein